VAEAVRADADIAAAVRWIRSDLRRYRQPGRSRTPAAGTGPAVAGNRGEVRSSAQVDRRL